MTDVANVFRAWRGVVRKLKLDSLSDDLVLSIAAFLSPDAYSQCRACSRSLHGLMTPAFLLRRRGAPSAATSLEALAVHEAVAVIGSNRVIFEGASTELREGFDELLGQYAAVLGRFERCRLHVDAHTGRHAPATFAPSFTRERAETVRSWLMERGGIEAERLTCTGWGKFVAVHARWPAGQESARGELYVEFDGGCYPARPAYYLEVPATNTPQDSDSEGEGGGGPPHDLLGLLQQMMQQAQQAYVTMRAVLAVFENYQKARVNFVQTVAELATRPQNIEALQNAGVMQLLRPLLLDNVPSIQQSAALALGRLANYNDELAEAVVSNEVLPQLVYSLSEQNRFYKKAAAFVLRAVAKHSPQLAQAVVDSGALDALVGCLEEFDPGVKESAAWALGYIARHNGELAQTVVDAGAVPLLVLCIQEPELTLKRIAASALSDICKHSPELAQAVVDGGAVAYLAPLIISPDGKLKRQVCSCLAQITKHSVDLAEVVVEAEIFPQILNLLKDMDVYVRKNAATCIREVAKHTPELAQLIVNAGGVGAMVDYVTEASGNARLPGIMTLGYISAFSETLALAVVVSKGIPPLINAVVTEPEDHIKSASAWSLGQIGRHSPDHAKALADANALPKLLAVYLHEASSDDLKTKAKRALKAVIQKCVHLPALEPLLHDAPEDILKYVVNQFAKVLPHDIASRRSFVMSGALQKILELQPDDGSQLKDMVRAITDCYPKEIVDYYSPSYSKQLLDQLDSSEIQ